MNQQPKINIDIKNTRPVLSPDGNYIFAEGVILRKISKFIAGTTEDAIMPIPVFYDIKTGKILIEMLPKELREEYQDLYDQEDPTK
jgi:hypothetical protein